MTTIPTSSNAPTPLLPPPPAPDVGHALITITTRPGTVFGGGPASAAAAQPQPRLLQLARARSAGWPVARRALATWAAWAISAARNSRALALLHSTLRWSCDLITTASSLLLRWSSSASSRAFSASGRLLVWMPYRRCAALLTLLTFCPSTPWARMVLDRHSSSRGWPLRCPPGAGISMAWLGFGSDRSGACSG